MVRINYLKKSITKINTKTLKQLKLLKDNEFIDNKLYYHLKPTAPRFHGQPKIKKLEVPIRPIVSYGGSPLYNLKKYIAKILKAENMKMLKMKITTPRILPRFPTASFFPLKMTR